MTPQRDLTIGNWRHVGGGCGVACDRPEYPCDDEYKNVETGERVTVYSTQACHFEMPRHIEDPLELYALAGVRVQLVVE